MDARSESRSARAKSPTAVERTSERELVVTRTIDAPAGTVFDAFTKVELFKQWWVPKSFGLNLVSCEIDARVGGQYRLVFRHGDSDMAFFGKYLEVNPPARLVWTNEESEDAPVTTLTLEEKAGKTLIVLHDLYPSKEAFEAASGEKGAVGESLDQLEELLAARSG